MQIEIRRALAWPLVGGLLCIGIGFLLIRGDTGGLVAVFGMLVVLATYGTEFLLKRRDRRP